MEILIFGAVFVALMVFVSTKIKKSAASAFEWEIIDKQDFTLVKPRGFISPIDESSKFAFEAYTKDFGRNDADEFRQARANLTIEENLTLNFSGEHVEKTGEKILSERIAENATEGEKIFLLESEKIEKNIPVKFFYKIIESAPRQKTYKLKVSILETYVEEYKNRVNEMLESFVLK